MSTFIKSILDAQSPSIDDLIQCFEEVKENGDIAVIKLDGERKTGHYTVFITFPLAKNREMIRADESDLKTALTKVLKAYLSPA